MNNQLQNAIQSKVKSLFWAYIHSSELSSWDFDMHFAPSQYVISLKGRGLFTKKTSPYQYDSNSKYKDKAVFGPSHIYNGIPYTGTTVSL